MDANDLLQYYRVVKLRIRHKFPRVSIDDVMQETFYQATDSVQRHGYPRKPEAWLCKIAERMALREYRKQRRMGACSVDLEEVVEQAPAPWEQVAERDAQQKIIERVTNISPTRVAALLGHYFDGLSCQELAEEYGSAPTAIKGHLYRGRIALAKALFAGDGA